MSVELLKAELNKLPLDVLEPLFKEILISKKIEVQEKQMYYTNFKRLHYILFKIHQSSERYKKALSLFEVIGSQTDEFIFDSGDVVDNLTVGQILNSPYMYRRIQLKQNSTNLESGYQSELNKYYRKFGDKICNSQYIKVIRNSLIARDIIPESKNEKDIHEDIFRLYGVR